MQSYQQAIVSSFSARTSFHRGSSSAAADVPELGLTSRGLLQPIASIFGQWTRVLMSLVEMADQCMHTDRQRDGHIKSLKISKPFVTLREGVVFVERLDVRFAVLFTSADIFAELKEEFL